MILKILKLLFGIEYLFLFSQKKLKEKIKAELRNLDIVINEDHTLASRDISPYYLDIKKSFGYPKFLILYSIYIAKYVYKKEYTCVAVSGYGGIPLGVILSVFLGINVSYIRNSLKNHGKIETHMDGYVPDILDNILLLDDVFTTGGSLKIMVDIIKKESKSKIGAVFVLVKRDEGILPKVYGMEVKHLLTSGDLV
ncbi:MAG: hypothetical protein KAI57_02355 [Candidatus Pacebacteria bacterium]|nr:hypothetical protein [Candidatus Paceibacterota bacterium]